MPCCCSGVKYEKCACKVLAASHSLGPALDQRGAFKFRKTYLNSNKDKGIISCLVQNIYHNCAAYNLRHCPLQRIEDKNSMLLACKDFTLLICFLLANFVIFLTIFARMTAHVSFVMFQIIRFIQKFLSSKLNHGRENIFPSSSTSELCLNSFNSWSKRTSWQ